MTRLVLLFFVAAGALLLSAHAASTDSGASWNDWQGSALRPFHEVILTTGSPLTVLAANKDRIRTIFPGSFVIEPDSGAIRTIRSGVIASWKSFAHRDFTMVEPTTSNVPEPRLWFLITIGLAFTIWNVRRRRRLHN